MKRKIFYILMIIISIFIIIFTYNDSFLYKEPIMKITSVINYDNTQNISGKIINNCKKTVSLNNEYQQSLLYSEKYKINDLVILSDDYRTIVSYKRDVYLVIIIVLFVDMLLIVGKMRGFLSILSIIIECIIYYLALKYYINNKFSLVIISIIISILYIFISFILSVGNNKKSYICMLAVAMTTLINLLLSFLTFYFTDGSGIMFDQLGFLLTPYKQIFFSEVIICGLGAIMDISITLVSSINELILKNPKITKKALYISSKNIGYDTMGTMLNVLFFTNICMSLTKYYVIYKNNISLTTIFSNYMSLDIARALITNIGIVLAIPITTWLSIRFLKGDKS